MITIKMVTAEAEKYSAQVDRSRAGAGFANVRASFVAGLIIADGYEGEDGTVVVPSEREAFALLGITRSPGQRGLKVARIAAVCGYTLETLSALRQGSVEYIAAATLFNRANRQGVMEKVTDDMWTAVEQSGPETLAEAVTMVDAMVEAEKDDRAAEAEAAREEKAAEKAEREEAEKAAATPAGKISALVALAANLTSIAHVGGLTSEEWAILVTVGESLANVEWVEPTAPEADVDADAA